jgi:hypothetical protein
MFNASLLGNQHICFLAYTQGDTKLCCAKKLEIITSLDTSGISRNSPVLGIVDEITTLVPKEKQVASGSC